MESLDQAHSLAKYDIVKGEAACSNQPMEAKNKVADRTKDSNRTLKCQAQTYGKGNSTQDDLKW